MRFLVRVTLPHETANDLIKHNKLGDVMGDILAEIRPEAAYFTEMEGYRTGIFIVSMSTANEMTKIAEPFFLRFEATVEFHPVMLPDDLMAAAPYLEAAAKKHA